MAISGEESDELLKQNNWPRSQLGQRQTIQRLLVGEPPVRLYRMTAT